MKNTKDYPHNISVIDTHYYRKQLVASHLIVENGRATFIDVGTTPGLDYLLEGLAEKNLRPDDVDYIILTHIHLDHAGGAGALMQKCPNARLVVHQKGAKHIIDPEKLINATIAIYGFDTFNRLYGNIVPVAEERIIIGGEGLVIDFQGRNLHFLDTPGHARHHLCIHDPRSRGIFTGDTLGLAYPELQVSGKPPFLIPTTSPVGFEPAELAKSILRVEASGAEFFYLTHFGPVAADYSAVKVLVKLIGEHASIGESTPDRDIGAIKAELLDLYHQAYTSYTGELTDVSFLKKVLGGDLELNAQGVAVWYSRSQSQ